MKAIESIVLEDHGVHLLSILLPPTHYKFTRGATYRSMLCSIPGICEKAPQKTFSYKKNLKRLKYAEKAASKGQKARRKHLKFRTAAKGTALQHKKVIRIHKPQFGFPCWFTKKDAFFSWCI